MSERKAVIKNADMSEDMQQDAIDSATQVRTLPGKNKRWAAQVEEKGAARDGEGSRGSGGKENLSHCHGKMTGGLSAPLTAAAKRQA